MGKLGGAWCSESLPTIEQETAVPQKIRASPQVAVSGATRPWARMLSARACPPADLPKRAREQLIKRGNDRIALLGK